MASAPDPVPVAGHDDEHLRRFLLARRAGDATQLRHWWLVLLEDFHDRIRLKVSYVGSGSLDREEQEDAVQASLESFSTFLVERFDGTSMGELVNAMTTIVGRRCADVQRRESRHSGPSLDAGWEQRDPDRPAPAWEYDQAALARERAEEGRDLMGFLVWALPQLRGNRRRVAELTLEQASTAAICAELGITEPNAYQLRSRAASDLRKLKEQYDA